MDQKLADAYDELRQQVAELFFDGMWSKSPGGDQYIWEGPTSKIDDVEEALAEVDRLRIEAMSEEDDD